jgi:hypothetical protein
VSLRHRGQTSSAVRRCARCTQGSLARAGAGTSWDVVDGSVSRRGSDTALDGIVIPGLSAERLMGLV